MLDVHHNLVADLTPLQHLAGLAVINAAANRIQQIPCLTALTQLTELNLRSNSIRSIEPIATAAEDGAGPEGGAGTCIFPSSLRRLSLARNQIAYQSSLQQLRHLPCLEDICLDGNPFATVLMQHACTAPGAAGGSAYRDAVMGCCPPTLLMLDMQPVSCIKFWLLIAVLDC